MATNLVDVLRKLFFSPEETAKYMADPEGYLEDEGVEDASYEEINEAVALVCSGPVSQGAVVTGGNAAANVGSPGGVASSGVSSGASGGGAQTMSPPTAPPPPPPPPADMSPQEAMEQVINYYVTEVSNVTNVDDRDTYTDNSANTVVNADHGSDVDITNDNDTVTASGDGAVAAGEDVKGAATGDGAVAAGEDIEGDVNTGTNSGVVGSHNDIDDSIFGDGNTQANDNNGPVVIGDENIVADEGNAAGGDIVDIDDSTLNGANTIGSDGSTTVQDNDTSTVNTHISQVDNSVDIEDSFKQDNSIDVQDSFNPDYSINDSFDVEDSFKVEDSFTVDVQPASEPADDSMDA